MASVAKALTRGRLAALAAAAALGFAGLAPAGPLDEMPVERWAKLREAERFQLNVAEKYYREIGLIK